MFLICGLSAFLTFLSSLEVVQTSGDCFESVSFLVKNVEVSVEGNSIC